eukprot:6427653-Prymnesium_polylepis.1
MTHAVAAWSPDRPGGVVVGKATHMWCPRVSVAGPPCYPELQSRCRLMCRKPGLELGECPVPLRA